MNTVATLLDKAKSAQGIPSDYKLALVLDVAQSAVQNYRHGRTRPDDRVLQRLATLAGEDPHLLAVQMQAERAANDESRALWQGLAARLQTGAATVSALVLAFFMGLLVSVPSPAQAHAERDLPKSVYYVYSCMAPLVRRWLADLSRKAQLLTTRLSILTGRQHWLMI